METPRRLLKHSSKPPSRENSADRSQESVHVFCRLKALDDENDCTCIKLLSPTTLTIFSQKDNLSKRDIHYKFNHIFSSYSSQKEIFEHVALPLLEGVVNGKNGLLFTYGITGSGKTYTLTGEPNNPGIMPRCIDTLFNSIGGMQTQKYVIKSDKMNGFEIQSESDAAEDRTREAKINRNHRGYRKAMGDYKPFYSNDNTKISNINESSFYCVFISYIEIYNNIVFDLLDETTGIKPESKILREDSQNNMYVNGGVELEVKSAAEAFELFNRGQKRKRMAHTVLNAESSRSHSIFNIRVVHLEQFAQNSQGKSVIPEGNMMKVGQLSLVDLAGSERCSRTQNTGLRLREASSINNSLMSLRMCIEILRENQKFGTNKLVPYRDSRLTLLFKSFFEGGGQISMIVCINPSTKDYEENLHVLKFAEMTKDIKITVSEVKTGTKTPKSQNNNIGGTIKTPGTIKKSKLTSFVLPKLPVMNLDPDMGLENFLEQHTNLTKILQLRKGKSLVFNQELRKKENHFRKRLTEINQNALVTQTELQSMKTLLKKEKRKNQNLELKIADMEIITKNLEGKINSVQDVIKKQQQKIDEKDMKINHNLLEKERTKHKQALQAERLAQDLEAKHRQERAQLQAEMEVQDLKLKKVKEFLDTEVPISALKLTESTPRSAPLSPEKDTLQTFKEASSRKDTPYRRNVGTGSSRRRRSRSAGEVWLEHNAIKPVPLGTVLQPSMKKRKSVSKLKNADDVTNPKQNKYCLITQEQDNGGEVETKVYKGDILTTCGGGAQVVFNDVEKLTQESPTGTPRSPYR